MATLEAEKTTEKRKEKRKIRGEAAIARFVRLVNSVHPDDLEAFHEYLAKRWFNGKTKH